MDLLVSDETGEHDDQDDAALDQQPAIVDASLSSTDMTSAIRSGSTVKEPGNIKGSIATMATSTMQHDRRHIGQKRDEIR